MLMQVKSTNYGADGANVKCSVKCLYAFILRKCLSKKKFPQKIRVLFQKFGRKFLVVALSLLACWPVAQPFGFVC